MFDRLHHPKLALSLLRKAHNQPGTITATITFRNEHHIIFGREDGNLASTNLSDGKLLIRSTMPLINNSFVEVSGNL
jgi:hypothetical protein